MPPEATRNPPASKGKGSPYNTKSSRGQMISTAPTDRDQLPVRLQPATSAQSLLPHRITPENKPKALSNPTQNVSGPSVMLTLRKTPPVEGKPRNVLRRKDPSIENYAKNSKIQPSSSVPTARSSDAVSGSSGSTSGQEKGSHPRNHGLSTASQPDQKESSSSDIQVQRRVTTKQQSDLHAHPIPKELRGLSTSTCTPNIPHLNQHIPTANTPSTVYSESPGPWSSRTSTPTSVSSYSPGILQPKFGSRLRQPSPNISGKPVQHLPARSTPMLDKSPSAAGTPSFSTSLLSMPPETLSKSAQSLEKPPSESSVEVASLAKTPPLRRPSTKLKPPSSAQVSLQGRPSVESQRDETTEVSQDQARKLPHQPPNLANTSRLTTAVASSRPSRPSRKGTTGLQLESSPIIHSNLPVSRLPGHKRQGSIETSNYQRLRSTSLRPPVLSTESLPSKSSPCLPHPSPSLPTNENPNFANPKPQDQNGSSNLKGSRETKEQVSDKTKRFGIFSRKARTVPEVAGLGKEGKQSRKGPAAGTGHEGYGKYAQRGRRPSISSSSNRARSTSTSASKNSLVSRGPPEMDDFLRDRLEPIVINGGGLDGAELARTQSEQSIGSIASTTVSEPYPRPPYPGGYSTESVGRYSGYFVQSPEHFGYSTGDLVAHQDECRPSKRTVLKRRSFRKSQFFGGEKGCLLDNAAVPPTHPSIDSVNESVTSLSDVNAPAQNVDCYEPRAERELQKKKSEKWPRWNFLQRSRHLHRKASRSDLRTAAMAEVPASITKLPTPRRPAHYALLDDEQIDSDSLEDILQRIEDSPPTEAEYTPEQKVGLGLKKQHGLSVLLPELPASMLDRRHDKPMPSPKVFFHKDHPVESTHPESAQVATQKSRGIRLASVGRIPKVIPRDNSPFPYFSRPFCTVEAPSVTTTSDVPTYCSSTPLHSVGLNFNLPVSSDSAVANVANSQTGDPPVVPEFLSFPPRKGSDVSGSSTSDSRISLTAVTAVVPPPRSKLTDDEIWYEYDDFIDHVVSLMGEQKPEIPEEYSQDSSKFATEATKGLRESLEEIDGELIMTSRPNLPNSTAVTPPELLNKKSSIHLRRSMVISALHSSLALSMDASSNEFHSKEYEDGDKDVKQATQESSNSHRTKRPPLPGEQRQPGGGTNHRRNILLLELAERNRYGAIAQANLRSGSLMTSRWLSFGRVLFSPAQNHVQSQDHQSRILVIDGLGNDDWSFYCALTYPTAIVYSLSMSPSTGTSKNPAAWDPPSNHRTVHHSYIDHPFPFPKGFFTVVILRFPAACSEEEIRVKISECKRVLRDGGYIELSVLDLDMVNMGSRARKAVRALKERMFATDPTISLKPASDTIQRLLGKKGFENLNRCMVVVPVAGSIVASSDTSSSNQSVRLGSKTTTQVRDHQSSTAGNSAALERPTRRVPSDEANVSLGDLLSDPSTNDESIARTVARVGRWWYTRCYESTILVDGNLDDSMWSDRRLLRECQRRGTGFKLLIAYAQKPRAPRRTASV
ncbi:hypothetical protein VTO42DRAFT_546 [Malbranchea cinnamomea]